MGLTEQEYFTGLQAKQVLVLGLGVSNRPLVRPLFALWHSRDRMR